MRVFASHSFSRGFWLLFPAAIFLFTQKKALTLHKLHLGSSEKRKRSVRWEAPESVSSNR